MPRRKTTELGSIKAEVAADNGNHAKTSSQMSAIFPTASEFRKVADRYFDECDDNGLLYGEMGLCLALSNGNAKGRTVSLNMLRMWHDGKCAEWLQDEVQRAYMRISAQVESDPRYQEKAMVSRGIFLQKQARFGGYQDKVEQKQDTTVRILFGEGTDASDFK